MPSKKTSAKVANQWTDPEKISLLLAVIKNSGTMPNWSEASVPVGRTIGAARECYRVLIKDPPPVPMASGNAITPTAKRGFKKRSIQKARIDSTSASKLNKKARISKPKKPKSATKAPSQVADELEGSEFEGVVEDMGVSEGEINDEEDGQSEAVVEDAGVSEGKGEIDLVGRDIDEDELSRIGNQAFEAEMIEYREAIHRELCYSPRLTSSM